MWERSPQLDATGRPVNFLDVDITSHLAFYRAGIAAITEEDAYSGLLVSMHGAGIYRQRYGRDPALGLSRAAEAQELVDAFVAEQEASHEERLAETGASEDDRWHDYELLQIYDRLSLHFCMLDAEAGSHGEFQGYRIEPLGPLADQARAVPVRERPRAVLARPAAAPEVGAHRGARGGARAGRAHDRVAASDAGVSAAAEGDHRDDPPGPGLVPGEGGPAGGVGCEEAVSLLAREWGRTAS